MATAVNLTSEMCYKVRRQTEENIKLKEYIQLVLFIRPCQVTISKNTGQVYINPSRENMKIK